VAEWRKKHPLTSDGFYDEPFHPKHSLQPDDDKISPLWFVSFPDWPWSPYLEANVWNPNTDELIERSQGHGLQVDLEEIIRFPPELEWEYWPAGSVLASSSSSIVALHVDWTKPLKDIKEQFDQWLSWASKHVANRPIKPRLGKATPLSMAQTALKTLTALRLLSDGRRWKEAQEIYIDDLYSDQPGWINAARSAEERIKNLGDEWG